MRYFYNIAFAAFLGVTLLLTAPLAGAERRYKIDQVTFEGNRTFPDSRLQGLMLSRPSAFLRSSYFFEQVFLDDIENIEIFYQQNGYLEVALTDTVLSFDTVHHTVDIHLQIDEGELTHLEGLTVFGNTVFEDSILLKKVRMVPGDAFQRNLIQESMLAMLSLYAENGYLDAAIKPEIKINSEAHLAMVDFVITERYRCTVSEIIIEGNQKTRPSVIKRELSFQPGEVVRYSRLMASQRQLYLTGLFESVFLQPRPTRQEDSARRDIIIDIKENLSSEYNLSVGYGSVDKARASMEVFTRNLAGTARKIGSTLKASFIRRGVEASFTEPWTFGTRWKTDINLLFEFMEEPGYDLSRIGGRLTVGRNFGKNTNAALTYRFEEGKLRHVEVTDIPVDYDPRVRSLILTFNYDTRDNLFNPNRGTYIEWTNEMAGAFLSGGNTFARSDLRLKWFKTLDRETIFGSALDVGWMDYFGSSSDIPLSERFYTGGPNSLRGFQYQKVGPLQDNDIPLGGNFKVVWNLAEIRHTVYKMFGVVGFVEFGNIWSRMNDFNLKDFRPDAGAGLRLNTPLGILRLDFGVNLDRRAYEPRTRIYFNMGHAF
ncbi:MAG: outer membrane protein assembly factor BamA [candidate division Zixibacteria bacterium]|nr:outer membrane protein assembly factor BamA [candidate division Zixibacteria bacterium]